MKACDRHGRSEGSLKAAAFEFSVLDFKNLDEMGRPTVLLDHELCEGCVNELVEWYRTSEPTSLLAVPLAVVKEGETG